ncbi:hypothetical protein BU25DRAFT_401962 [Macroventuria anomochaeta]|uniref:Uncharacterized protein n=1 Tax=Macroventuria anomochaeta TaxID=301207 RepID=A0ACB6RNJ3_9PLEO|nr:uncharacterized protein BU25DRAFT_401962 [Macroventuria anomochaeta]KAF2622724.1 hypothetical protein BU25DRAFT_401962 [Macroventuria anomochaeta]
MAPNLPDHYLWLGLGVFTFFAIHHVASGLRTVKQLTEVHRPVPKPLGIRTPTSQEDAIKTDSLLLLAQSHNVEIRASATKLLCERFYANDSARQLLLRDLGSRKKDVQRRAQLAFRLLRDYGVFRERGLSYGYGGIEPRVQWNDVEVLSAGGGLREREDAGEDERDARRRRREAVVIHDGEGRVGEGDVWMRDREGVMSLDMEVGELVIDGVVH